MRSLDLRIGFIGLGDQGGGIAQRLIATGHDVTLWARRPESLERFAGTSSATTIAGLGGVCDLIGICVVDDAGVRQVCDDLIPAMAAGSIIVVHSTISPSTCIELAAQAAARGIALIDAPVSGGGQMAAEGKITIMVGGDDAVVARARPVFEAMGSLVLHLGGIGAGQNAKLINNTLLAAHLGLADHALTAAAALGLDRAAFIDLIKASSGRSYGFEIRARMPSPAAFAHGGALLAKDSALLGNILPDDPGASGLRAVADPFLAQTGAKT